MSHLWLFFCILLIRGIASQLRCGFPGKPKNGKVIIEFRSSKAVAKYECPGSLVIDGDVERTCTDDGTWTGTIPRCATEAPVKKSFGNDKFVDGNTGTCDWIHEGNAVLLEFQNKSQVYGIEMIYPAPYENSLKEAEFGVQVLDGGRVTGTGVDGTFHEKDSKVQWRLNQIGDAVRVELLKRDAHICEIKVLTIPEECGEAEEPLHGHVEYDESSALCQCDPYYQVVRTSSVRTCSGGRWSGERCACSLSDIQTGQTYVILIVILVAIIVILLLAFIFRSKIKSFRELLVKAPAKSSNAQLDELQQMRP